MNEAKQGDLRVWWIPQVGATRPFYVPVTSVAEGKRLLETLGQYDQFQLDNRIKSDFCNAGGLEQYDDGSWDEWMHDETAETINELSHEEIAQLFPEEIAAQRWNALINCARVRPLGAAGLEGDTDPNGQPYNGYAHLGLEVWTRYSYNPEKLAEERRVGVRWLERFTDIAIEVQRAKSEITEGSGEE